MHRWINLGNAKTLHCIVTAIFFLSVHSERKESKRKEKARKEKKREGLAYSLYLKTLFVKMFDSLSSYALEVSHKSPTFSSFLGKSIIAQMLKSLLLCLDFIQIQFS